MTSRPIHLTRHKGHAKTCTEPLPEVYLDAAGTKPAPVQPQSHESIIEMAFHQAHIAAAYFVKVSADPTTTKEVYLAAQQTATDAASHAATVSNRPADKPPTPMLTPPQSDHTRQGIVPSHSCPPLHFAEQGLWQRSNVPVPRTTTTKTTTTRAASKNNTPSKCLDTIILILSLNLEPQSLLELSLSRLCLNPFRLFSCLFLPL